MKRLGMIKAFLGLAGPFWATGHLRVTGPYRASLGLSKPFWGSVQGEFLAEKEGGGA